MSKTRSMIAAALMAVIASIIAMSFFAPSAYAGEQHVVHLKHTNISADLLDNYLQKGDYQLSDGFVFDDEELLLAQYNLKYYGEDGLNTKAKLQKVLINGTELQLPDENGDDRQQINVDGIDGVEGAISVVRDSGLFTIWFYYLDFSTFDYADVKLTKDLDIEVVFEHTHSLDKVAEAPATCTESGAEAYWKCTDPTCGKMFSDEAGTTEITAPATIPAKGHDLKKAEAKDASYTAAGNKEHYVCAECGKCFSDPEGKTEITKDSWVIAKLAKKAQSMTVNAKKVSAKYKKIKKKAKTVSALTVKGAQGKVSYKIQKISTKKKLAKQANKKIKLAANGKLKLKKGLKKGTYKISVKVAVAETAEYKAAEKTVTVKVVVK